jgi:hypothetical protein
MMLLILLVADGHHFSELWDSTTVCKRRSVGRQGPLVPESDLANGHHGPYPKPREGQNAVGVKGKVRQAP